MSDMASLVQQLHRSKWYLVVAGVVLLVLLARSRPGSGQSAPAPDALRVPTFNQVPLDYSYIYPKVYQPRGYKICPGAPQRGWLYLHKPVSCRDLFKAVLDAPTSMVPVVPPKHMPSLYRDEYLLDGTVDLIMEYATNIYNGNPTPLEWTQEYVDGFIQNVGVNRQGGNYGEWDNAVYDAMDAYDLKGQRGLVVGSETPWVEAAALYRGAAHVTTSEYRQIIASHDRVSAYHPQAMAQAFLDGELKEFDFAASYSSIEHSGLGRYGDPLNPQGDLREIEKVACLVKPGGLLFLGFPINGDAVMFNVHRLYGPVRLPLVTANWEVLNIHSHTPQTEDFNLSPIFFNEDKTTHEYQLVIVLKNKRTNSCH